MEVAATVADGDFVFFEPFMPVYMAMVYLQGVGRMGSRHIFYHKRCMHGLAMITEYPRGFDHGMDMMGIVFRIQKSVSQRRSGRQAFNDILGLGDTACM